MIRNVFRSIVLKPDARYCVKNLLFSPTLPMSWPVTCLFDRPSPRERVRYRPPLPRRVIWDVTETGRGSLPLGAT